MVKTRKFSCAVAAWWLLCCGTAPAAPVAIDVVADARAPKLLWVAREGVEADPQAWSALEPAPSQSGLFARRYRADLAPGGYRFVAYSPNMPGDFEQDRDKLRGGALALRGGWAGSDAFVVDSAAVELGSVELHAGSTLGLLVRVAATGAPWRTPSERDTGDPAVAALRQRLRWFTAPRELADGGWAVLASGNQLAVSAGDAGWQMYRVMADGRPTVFSEVASGLVVVGGEGPRLEWRPLDGEPLALAVDGLSDGSVEAVHCDSGRRCVVGIVDESGAVRLFHSSDAALGGWRALATLPALSCDGWSCTSQPMVHRVGDEVIGLGGKRDMWRIGLADGRIEQHTLSFDIAASQGAAGRLSIGERYSVDGGRQWQTGKQRMRDGVLQFDRDGGAFAISINIGVRFHTPIVRHSPDGSSGWVEWSELPMLGHYVVGARSHRQYLHNGLNLWRSNDRGKRWELDTTLYAALQDQTGEEQ